MLICWPPQRDRWEHLREMMKVLIIKSLIYWPSRRDSGDAYQQEARLLPISERWWGYLCNNKRRIYRPSQRDFGDDYQLEARILPISERFWRCLSTRSSYISHLREIVEMLINKRLIYWLTWRDGGDIYQQEVHLLTISERWWGYLCINKRLIYWPSQRDFGDDYQQEDRILPHLREIVEILINKRLIYWPSQRDFGDAYQQEAHLLTNWDKWWRYLSTRSSSVNKLRDMAEILINKMLIYWPFQRDGRDIYQQEVHLLSIS
jgi:hypothetical protein